MGIMAKAKAFGSDTYRFVSELEQQLHSELEHPASYNTPPVKMESSKARVLAWNMHRLAIRRGRMRAFSEGARHKVLLISVPHRISDSQTFPFYFYRAELRERYGVQVREVLLSDFQANPESAPNGADTVCLQTWFDIEPAALKALLASIRRNNPNARIVYLDWFAPTDLRLASTLHGSVDMYVKKHVLRDRNAYARPTYGDTNLMDYYGRRYGLAHETKHFPVSQRFLDELIVGPSFATADYMIPTFIEGEPPSGPRPIDIHGRLGASGTPWYEHMRRDAIKAMEAMSDLRVESTLGVKFRRYLEELAASKMCFSPFGYGEVCWRDYEAIMSGSLLLKPDTSHVETDPDIFLADETYVPLRWDFADLEEKVRHYLDHPDEREAIVQRAFHHLQDYFVEGRFLDQMQPILALPQRDTRSRSPHAHRN